MLARVKGRSALLTIARVLTETTSPGDALRLLAESAAEVTAAAASAVFEVTVTGDVALAAAHGLPETMTGWTDEAGAIGPELANHVLDASGGRFEAARAIPMVSGGKIFGALVLLFRKGAPMPADAEQVARGLVDLAATAMEKAAQHAHLARALEELRASQETLLRTEKLRALGEMAAGISHDLKNVLAPLSLHVQIVRRAVAKKNEADALDAVAECGAILRRGNELLERLRDFSRQSPDSRLAPVDLNALVREAAAIAKPRMASRAGALNRIVEEFGEPPTIPARASEVVSAIVNLIVNAIDAMPDGGTIALRTGARDGRAFVAVVDEGPGMSEETQQKVFQPFFTTKGERGTGLGLAMVYASMQRHGGSVTLDTALGRGSTFALWFPIPIDE
jgi:signal transduction histidine kinase